MTNKVMSNPRFERLLECVSETYKTVEDISEDFDRKYPPWIEVLIRVFNLIRRKVFSEKYQEGIIHSVEKELDELHKNGYVEMMRTNFYEEALPRETKFYRLTKFGRTAIFQSSVKKK